MRRMTWTAAILLVLSLVLAACGTKDAASVVKDLDKVVKGMESYQGSGTMTLHTGQEPLQYDVEVWYQQPEYYRISLTNAKKDITQIVLKNDDGVFVLTPRLNKVFRFQSDWPQNQGQVYLYQTLVQSILKDNSRQFAEEDKAFVFDVMANYNNGSLARQKIWLDKSTYKPQQVEVSDTNAAVMVEVKFNTFEFDPKFEKSAFETEANMKSSAASNEQPTMADPDAENNNVSAEDGKSGNEEPATDDNKTPADDNTAANDENSSGANNEEEDASAGVDDPDAAPSEMVVMEPVLPEGTFQKDQTDIIYGGNAGVITRYSGTHNFTLIQTQPKDEAASIVPGYMVDLGFTYGELSGDEQQTLTWTYEGNAFRLTSADLDDTQLIAIAQSVQGEMGK
ncbi:DUF4367 domain-containing protein [Paenibacillus sp. GCM10023252]|uniref:LolA family protein n=1 Tax=Paenibacillus sp. GCM10023252 TaxID=3252649 RepID=UPI00361C029D